jgi:thiol-disulfide isomerase/thioredoxin
MHFRKLFSAAAILTAAVILPASRLWAQDMGIEVGKTAPAVSVQSLDGRALDLSKYVGKGPVMLEFWATWCPNCKELVPTLLAAEKKYGTKVKFLAVAVNINQTPDHIRKYLAVHPMPHETVFDATGSAAEGFDAPATSYVVMLDRKGRVVYTGLGGKQDLDSAIAKGLQ